MVLKKESIERKTLTEQFLQHAHPNRESYLFLERNLCSLFIPSPIVIPIERRFVLRHYLHPFKVLRVFLELGKHWKMPRMADAIWSLLWDPIS